MHTSPVDLIIIGGGVLGTFHAYHALQMGLRVRLFERDQSPQGASVRNFGQVVPSGMDAKWQRYGRTSLRIYKSIQQQVDVSARNLGSVYLASDEEEMQLLEEMAHINKEAEYPSMLLTAAQCLKRYAGLRADYVKGGLFFPEEITVDAREMVRRVLGFLCKKKGLAYHPRTLIREIQPNGQQVHCQDHVGNTYAASQLILCTGHEFKVLFPDLFAQSDLEVSQLQMMETLAQPNVRFPGNILTGLSIRRYESFRACPSYTSIKARENEQAFWKKWGVHILLKQGINGSVIIGDSHTYADAARIEELGFDIRPEINTYMLEEAKKIFKLEDWRLKRVWLGQYSQCKTRDIFQQSVGNRVHIVTGIGGKGMTASPGFSQAHIASLFG